MCRLFTACVLLHTLLVLATQNETWTQQPGSGRAARLVQAAQAEDLGWSESDQDKIPRYLESLPPCAASVTLSTMIGSIEAQGGPPRQWGEAYRVCRWNIIPDARLKSIDFQTEYAYFTEFDHLVFYAAGEQAIASFNQAHQLPSHMSLLNSDEAVLVLRSTSDVTRFKIKYECHKTEDIEVLGFLLSPARMIVLLTTFSIVGCFIFICLPIGICWYSRVRRQIERNYEASRIVAHEEHMRRHARATEEENQILGQLDQLPCTTTGELTAEATTDQTECTLCLEDFGPEDQIRVLPCSHFFHKDCIDQWFRSRRFRLRTCPLCRGDPLPNRTNRVGVSDEEAEILEELEEGEPTNEEGEPTNQAAAADADADPNAEPTAVVATTIGRRGEAGVEVQPSDPAARVEQSGQTSASTSDPIEDAEVSSSAPAPQASSRTNELMRPDPDDANLVYI